MPLNNVGDEIILSIALYLYRPSDINALVRTSGRLYITLNWFLYRSALKEGNAQPLTWAAQHGKEATYQWAIAAWPLRTQLMLHNATNALHVAAQYGNLAIVKDLIFRGVFLNKQRRYGLTPVQTAIAHEQTEVLQWMLENGGDITSCWLDDKYQTALHVAASRRGCLEMVKLLLKKGLDIEARDKDLRTPLARALFHWSANDPYECALGRIFTPDLLQSLSCSESKIWPPNIELIRLLLANRANLDAVDMDGKTPRGYIFYHPNVDVRMLYYELPPRKLEIIGVTEQESR